MATALQRQLAAIHAKSTNELDLKAQRAAHSKSLLFEPSVAATQSMEVIYQISYEGFEELCALDARFIRFEKSIFALHSKNQDRQLMTAAENRDLDAAIEAFLNLVGARILLKPAIKAIEWLIRRFHAHEHNYESLVITFLPYHSTPIFSTLLSILPKQLNATLKFLHNYIGQAKSPPRSTFVNAAAYNTAFFSALNRYIIKAAQAQTTYPVLISFWASIMTQAVNDMFDTALSGRKNVRSQREEDLLTRILPVLNEGLAMKHTPELLLGCYMIVTVLVSKASLDDRTLDALMAAVIQGSTVHTLDAAMSCAAVIAEKKESVTVPKSVLKSILKVEDVQVLLKSISASQNISRFVLALIQTVLSRMRREKVSNGVAFVESVLANSILPEAQQAAVTSQVLHTIDQSLLGGIDGELVGDLKDLKSYIADMVEEKPDQAALEMDMDVDEKDEPEPEQLLDTPLELDIPAEARENSQTYSFFDVRTDYAFWALRPAFEQAARSQSRLAEFVALPFLAQTNPIRYTTFFARIWTGSTSVNARFAALQAANTWIRERDSKQDLQTLLPYALVALADAAVKVRRQAVSLIRLLSEHAGASSDRLGSSDVYGPLTVNVKWLSSKDLSAFTNKAILPSLEECVSDNGHISHVLLESLGGHSSSAHEHSGERLKSSQKPEIFQFLVSHLNYTNSFHTRLTLLSALNRISKAGGHPRSKYLMSFWKGYSEVEERGIRIECEKQGIDSQRLDREVLAVAQGDDPESVSYLLSICLSDIAVRSAYKVLAFERLAAIWPQFRANRQTSTAEALVTAALTQSGITQEQAVVVLKSVRLSPEVLSSLIEQAVGELNHRDQPSASKRRRTDTADLASSAASSDHAAKAIARLTLVMELVDGQRTGSDINLFYSLFHVLQALQDFRVHNTSDLGYIQNICLSSLSAVMLELNKNPRNLKIDASKIRTDLLVDCVRNTTSVQARSLALLLLSDLSRHVPQAVLHSIMPVFTLMSSTTLRQDDEFAAHVVDQTIQQVIPLLADSLRNQKKDLVAATAEIILSFAAAFEHIAAHRRLQLYRLLASSLGASESLFAVIATLVDHFAASDEHNMQRDEVEDFVVELFRQFQSVECMSTIGKLITLSLDSLQPQPTLAKTLLKQDAGAPSTARILSVLPHLLQAKTFNAKLRRDLSDKDISETLRALFAQSLEGLLKLTSATSSQPNFRLLCSRALETLLALFPLNELASSIEPLMRHEDQDICRSVLKTLEVRVRTVKNVDKASKQAIMQLLPRLTQILQDEAAVQLKPNALAAIDQICERFGKSDTAATADVAQVLASSACLGNDNEVVRVLSLHCLASVVGILQNEFIPLLQPVMKSAIDCLRSSLSTKSRSLHTAAYAFFTSLVDNVPFMISKVTLRQVVELSHESAMAGMSADEDENRVQFLQLVATKVEIATVLDVAESAWNNAVQQGSRAVNDHLDMVNIVIENHSKGNISRNAQAIFKVFFKMFDLRHDCTSSKNATSYSSNELDVIEQKLITVAIACVFKLNDTVFRPFFTELLEWSTTSLSKRESAHRTLRSMTFYNFVGALSDKLKSIFTSYFNYLIDSTKGILQAPASKDASSLQLTSSVLQALTSSFKHDQDDFWQSPSHFDPIATPLISQLTHLPPPDCADVLIPCITELAIANEKSADHHKVMNSQLLQLFRHDSAKVRLVTVKAQMSLARALKDEWLAHLPEMLPFISELQDDDDEGVARETERWIRLVEEVLGESLDAMLQ